MSSNLELFPSVVVSSPPSTAQQHIYSSSRAGVKRTHDYLTAVYQQQQDYSNCCYNDLLVPAISPAANPHKFGKFSCNFTAEEFPETSPLSFSDTSSCYMEMDASSSPNNTYSTGFAITNKVGGSGRDMIQLPTEDKPLQKEQSKCGFTLFITDEPEENYRARYESEGCRGPMKGRNGGCPSVMLTYHQGYGTLTHVSANVTVELTNGDGIQLQSCRLDSTDDGQNLSKTLQFSEKTQFDNLRIRRLKKTDAPNTKVGASMPTTKKVGGGRGKQDEKQAHLSFTAKIIIDTKQQPVILKAISSAIFLNANHDPPEIHKVVPQYGTPGDSIAIIGTRMHSPRVTFIYTDGTGRDLEMNADYEKEISHQNALVVKVPMLPPAAFPISNPLVITTHIRVTAGKGDRTGREPLRSHPSPFTYIKQGPCKECSFKQSIPPTPPNAPSYSAAIYHAPSPYISLRQTPPPPTTCIMPQLATPSIPQTPSNSAPVEVEQILSELCEDTITSPHGSPYTTRPTTSCSPYNSPIHYQPPTNYPVGVVNISGARGGESTKLEELDVYLPTTPPFTTSTIQQSQTTPSYHQSSPSMMHYHYVAAPSNNYNNSNTCINNNNQNPPSSTTT